MASGLADARRVARRSRPAAIVALEQWLRIPSVSGSSQNRRDVDRAADWVARRLNRMTRSVTVVRAHGGPVVVARITSTSTGESTRGRVPTLMVYGHLDVKPAGPGWTSDPFEPQRRDTRLVARGASDDKGQLMAHLVALEAWVAAGGPPCNVVVVVDGAEEIGSPGLDQALDSLHGGTDRVSEVDAVLISDTRAAALGRPTLTVSQRGRLDVRITVDVGGADVHAGRFGGAVVDPSLVLAAAVTSAAEAISAIPPAEQTAPDPTDDVVRASAGGRTMAAGRLAARATRWSATSVTSLHAGGAPGAIPTRATADLDIRLPPGVPPATARTLLVSAVGSAREDQAVVDLRCGAGTIGAELHHPAAVSDAFRAACRAGFGVDPVEVASGGSIPAVAVLKSRFSVDPLLFGLGPSNDAAHGPDEYLDLRDWGCGVDASVVFMENLARAFRAGPRPTFAGTSRPISGSER